jgi:hypothetical protein
MTALKLTALDAAALQGKRRPVILTMNQRDRITVDRTVVDIRPAREWLAGG